MLEKYPDIRNLSHSSRVTHESAVRLNLLPYFGQRAVTSITPEIIEDVIAAKRAPAPAGKPLADSSLGNVLVTLQLILRRAVRARLLTGNPAREIDWRAAKPPDVVDPFTGRELRELVAAAERLDPPLAALLRVWAQSRMRAGEVFGLRRGDVNLDTGEAFVQRSWSRQRLGPTKTRTTRLVSFLHPVLDDVDEWQPDTTDNARAVLAMLRAAKAQSLDPTAFLFTTPSGRPFDSSTFGRSWRRIVTAARVRYRWPEQLRHTFASTMLLEVHDHVLALEVAQRYRRAVGILEREVGCLASLGNRHANLLSRGRAQPTIGCSSATSSGDRARSMNVRSSSTRRRPAAFPSGVAPAAASASRLSNQSSATPS